MDIHSSTHAGSRALHYPTLTRGHAAARPNPADTADSNATRRSAEDNPRAHRAEYGTALPLTHVPEERPASAAGVEAQRALTVTQSGSAQSGAVHIETREGDIVTVNFSRVFAQAEISAASQSANGSVSGTARAAYQSAQLSYSVEGDLSEEEQAAIDHLLHRVDKVADRFFAGNVQAAFKQASHLKLNGEQIAGFALTLEQRSVQQAVSQYQSTQADAAAPTGPQALADYANQVRDLVEDPGVDGVVADPAAATGQLLDANVTLRALDEFGATLNQSAVNLLRDLLAYLLQGPQSSADKSTPASETSADAAQNAEATAPDATASTTDPAASAPETVSLAA